MYLLETSKTTEYKDQVIIHTVNAVVDYLKGITCWEIDYQEKYSSLIKTVTWLRIVPCQYFIHNSITPTSCFCGYESNHSIPMDVFQSRQGQGWELGRDLNRLRIWLCLCGHSSKKKVCIPITLSELFLRFHFTWYLSNLNVKLTLKQNLCCHLLYSSCPLQPPGVPYLFSMSFFSTLISWILNFPLLSHKLWSPKVPE